MKRSLSEIRTRRKGGLFTMLREQGRIFNNEHGTLIITQDAVKLLQHIALYQTVEGQWIRHVFSNTDSTADLEYLTYRFQVNGKFEGSKAPWISANPSDSLKVMEPSQADKFAEDMKRFGKEGWTWRDLAKMGDEEALRQYRARQEAEKQLKPDEQIPRQHFHIATELNSSASGSLLTSVPLDRLLFGADIPVARPLIPTEEVLNPELELKNRQKDSAIKLRKYRENRNKTIHAKQLKQSVEKDISLQEMKQQLDELFDKGRVVQEQLSNNMGKVVELVQPVEPVMELVPKPKPQNPLQETKVCPRCKEELPVVGMFGYRNEKGKLIPQSYCKSCRDGKSKLTKRQQKIILGVLSACGAEVDSIRRASYYLDVVVKARGPEALDWPTKIAVEGQTLTIRYMLAE